MAYEEIMTKPTLSSAISKTTSSISVTETNATMVMVAKISGKTVKSGTTLQNAAVESVVSQNLGYDGFSNEYRLLPDKNTYNALSIAFGDGSAFSSSKERVAIYDANKNYINGWYLYSVSDTAHKNAYIPKETLLNGASNAVYYRIFDNASNSPLNKEILLGWAEGSSQLNRKSYNKTTVLVPSEARNCVGYGLGISDSVCNIADFENGVHTAMCKEIDLGNFDYVIYDNSKRELYINISAAVSSVGICSAYNYSSAHPRDLEDKSFTIYSSGALYFRDTTLPDLNDTASVKAALKGKKLVYQMASTVTTPLKDFIRPLPVEQGGTLTLVNEHNLDMPSVIKYKKEV